MNVKKRLNFSRLRRKRPLEDDGELTLRAEKRVGGLETIKKKKNPSGRRHNGAQNSLGLEKRNSHLGEKAKQMVEEGDINTVPPPAGAYRETKREFGGR